MLAQRDGERQAPEGTLANMAGVFKNHADTLALMDFFVVPTVTVRLLSVFIILSHQRRLVVHVSITTRSTAAHAPDRQGFLTNILSFRAAEKWACGEATRLGERGRNALDLRIFLHGISVFTQAGVFKVAPSIYTMS